jgi:hypothetical protein
MSAEIPAETTFVRNVCWPLLQSAQNSDGGWGFHPGSQSRVEPTCWALHAMLYALPSQPMGEIIPSGFRFLRAAQLSDGAWPSSPEETAGSWVTSLASWVLLSDKDSPRAVTAGIQWLCDDWPRDSTPWRRLLRKFSSDRHLSTQNDSYRGWGWTPGTSSWVEPTSFALIALAESPKEHLPAEADRRRELAEAMLYDRMCPGGGWNCGNPRVYGVAGEPLVIPTVWALLALRQYPTRPENMMSIEWLENIVATVQGPGSLALARICLESYGRKWPMNGRPVSDFYQRNKFLGSISVTAWICMAWGSRLHWLSNANGKVP